MKKLINVLFGLGIVSLFFSCDVDNNFNPILQQELLVEKIATAPIVQAVYTKDLPSQIPNYVKTNHELFEIELAFNAPQLGYEVFLENGLCLYFDQDGGHLDHDGLHGDMGNHHGGGDHNINFCLSGDTIEIENLPQSVFEYITANYTGSFIVIVVLKPSGNLAVEINTGNILMFGPSGNYYHECDMQPSGGHGHGHGDIGGAGWHCDPDGNTGGGHHCGSMGHGGMGNHSGPNEHCWGGTSVSIDDIPTTITTYINDNYPDITVEHVMQTFNLNYFLRLSNCVRLVFDDDGNILFDSGS